MIASNHLHQLDGGGADLLLLYLEPETAAARRAPLIGIRGLSPIRVEKVRRLVARSATRNLSGQNALRLHAAVLEVLGISIDSGEPLDPRIATVIGELSHQKPLSASPADLAARVALSPSRFRHLFSEQVGMSCRRYILWLRLNRALEVAAQGVSLTTAAHESGFADAAHLSRTFRRMLGVTPSSIAGSMSARRRAITPAA